MSWQRLDRWIRDHIWQAARDRSDKSGWVNVERGRAMPFHGDAVEEARQCRLKAARARRLIAALGSDPDGLYRRFAIEQERRAAELEALAKQASVPPPSSSRGTRSSRDTPLRKGWPSRKSEAPERAEP